MRKEREAHARQKKEWEAQREKEKREWDAMVKAIEAIRTKQDPLGGLEALGVKYDDLTAAILSGGKQPDLKPLRDEVEKRFEEMQAQIRERDEKLAQAQREQQARQASENIRGRLEAGKEDRWELLHFQPNYSDEVFRLIEIEWKNAGEPVDERGNAIPTLTVEEAADKLEAYLVDQAKPYLQAKKLRASPAPEQAQRASANPGVVAAAKKPPATLTNTHAAQVARGAPALDPESRRKRALAVLDAQEE